MPYYLSQFFSHFLHEQSSIFVIIFQAMCFTLRERQLLGLHGLLPPNIITQDQQVYFVMQNFYRWDNDLDRFIYMMSLQVRSKVNFVNFFLCKHLTYLTLSYINYISHFLKTLFKAYSCVFQIEFFKQTSPYNYPLDNSMCCTHVIIWLLHFEF